MIEVQMTSQDGVTLATAGTCCRDDIRVVPAFSFGDDSLVRALISGQVENITIPDGTTNIRPYAFYLADNIKSIVVPDSVTSIGTSAFYGTGLTSFTFPSGLIGTGQTVLANCNQLQTLDFGDTVINISSSAIIYCTGLQNITWGKVNYIGFRGFRGCASIKALRIPAQIVTINNESFMDCTSLTEVIFDGKPNLLGATAFNGCTNLTSIKVPWSEGAVANAPWGATNATITYNYTGEG